MRNIDYLAYALGGLALVACSSKGGGVEGDNGDNGTGGAFNAMGGNAGVGGHYVVSSTSTDTGNTGGSNTLDTNCKQDQVPIQQLPPDIMIVMDRSLSMTDDVNGKACAGGSMSGNGNCGTESKWYKTIVAVKAVVNATQGKVNWGLFYLGSEPSQCGASKSPAVPITVGDSYTPIAAALDSEAFTGATGTPTTSVVTNATAYLNTLTDPNPKYLLLATDGEPNCRGNVVNTADADGAASAISKAKSAGYDTFVVGLATILASTGAETTTAALNKAAEAGGHPLPPPNEFYAVTDTDSLVAALNEIVTLATSCTIPLTNTPSGEWEIAISATDSSGATVVVPSSADDGWGYADPDRKSIALTGSYCEGLKSGQYTDFNFVYTCKGHPFIW